MNKYYYKKGKKLPYRLYVRVLGIILILFGLTTVCYVFFPIVSYEIYLAPAYASDSISSPIPQTTIIDGASVTSLLMSTESQLLGTDYSNVNTWFPGFTIGKSSTTKPPVSFYTLSIPAININDAQVTTVDTDLSKHLVNIGNTAVPPENGNTVIFGHSTLPYLFNPTNYKTIFAHATDLKDGDQILVTVAGKKYTYAIYSITVVSPDDTSVFAQIYDTSYLTLVTCTPPGTIWKRLIIRSRLQNS
jgi:sortase A